MKINAMMGFIALSFFTVLAVLAAEYYQNITAMQQGLQQCVVSVDETHTEVVWQDACE